jgi:hypothetical protein
VTPYLYPGGREGPLWLAVAAVATVLVVWRIAPAAWRPGHVATAVVAFVAAYLALAAGFESGFNQWLDHDVFERLRGGVDDVATWLVGAGGAFLTLAAVTAVLGKVGNR